MKILLATDGSEYSRGAARFLAGCSLTKNDTVLVLHAVNWIPMVGQWETYYVDMREVMESVAPKILDETAQMLKSTEAKIDTLFIDDLPDKAIVSTAVDANFDLIVMGARGLRGISSYIVGSVTKLTAIHSPKPVLVIKQPQWEHSRKLRVLFATDGSTHSDAMIRVLCSLPFPDDTHITVLNIISPLLSDIPERFAIEINDRIKNMVADTREAEFRNSEKIVSRTREQLERKFKGVDILTKTGEPSGEIISAAEALSSDIIAVASSGMRGIKGMLGSVSRYVLNHAKCSVLVGKG